MKKASVVFIAFICLLLLNTSLIIAEDNTDMPKKAQGQPATQTPATLPAPAQPTVTAESETQWLWAEVISLDGLSKTLLVKYLDYDTDQEKEMVMNIDEKTTFENVKSLDEIKPKDTVGIDYIISPDSKNIAKNISVEKMEEEQTAPQQEMVSDSAPAPVKPETTVAPVDAAGASAATAPASTSVSVPAPAPALEKETGQ